jgi:S-adenosylmethionine hydrolase
MGEGLSAWHVWSQAKLGLAHHSQLLQFTRVHLHPIAANLIPDRPSRPIALLTDFGSVDAYVGIVKGVILSRLPGAVVFDLTHGVAPQDVFGGALVLASAAPYCPADTVFMAVVDPGVGSSRRALCLRSRGRLFVGPDNGLLWLAATAFGEPEAFHVDRPELWLPNPSSTFHGRDVFAPVAAALAAGTQPEELGARITDPVRLTIPEPTREGETLRGEVIYVDRYGNAVTNVRPSDLRPGHVEFTLQAGARFISGPAKCYSGVGAGAPTIVLGSWGYCEVAIRDGAAALLLGLQRGSPVAVNHSPQVESG